MTKTQEARSMPGAVSRLRVSPPSKPTTLAVAVSLAMGATPAFAQWGNQVEAWIKGGTDRSYGGVEGLLPLTQDGNSLLFGDLKFKLGQQGSYEGNIGLGYRFLTQGNWAIGLYGGYDYRNSDNDNAFHQVSAGVEARSDSLDFRFNYYYPLSDEEYLKPGDNYDFGNFSIYRSGMYEEAMEGFDIEAGVLLPISDKWETRAYAAYYDFESDATDVDLNGWRVRVETRPMQNLAIGLSYQDDDYFDSQAALEVRYIFGKDAKPGVRKIRERMTDPWVKDIDIVVTGEEELRGKKYGKAVPGFDVVHIDSDRGSDVTGDGSYENPYASVDYCENGAGDGGKCHQDDNVAGTGDYNVIRLWEGDSQTGGMEYTPITLFNGQMLAGEPITARNIVYGYAYDPVDYDTMPVIDGGSGSPAVYLANDTAVWGVRTISGGIVGTNVSGVINIRYNDISNYYTGVGIDIRNTNVGYSSINIVDNDIAVAGDSATGVRLENHASGDDSASTMYVDIVGNYIRANGYYATGVALVNTSSGVGASAYQGAFIYDNYIRANGYYATGVALSNAASSSGSATQSNYIKYNSITANGFAGGTGVYGLNGALGGGSATQLNGIVNNGIFATDDISIDSATGVSLSNYAGSGSTAYQNNDIALNYIYAASEVGAGTGVLLDNSTYYGTATQDNLIYDNWIRAYGNSATGVSSYNSATSFGTATQVNDVYFNLIQAYGTSSAAGVSIGNSATFGGYANQDNYIFDNTIQASASNYATGVSIGNSTLYGSAEQDNFIKYNAIGASASNYAAGVSIGNSTTFGGYANQANYVKYNAIGASANYYTGYAVGVSIGNSTFLGGSAGQSNYVKYNNPSDYWYGGISADAANATGVSISNYSLAGSASQNNLVKYNDISATGNYNATGVSISNSTVVGSASQSNYVKYNNGWNASGISATANDYATGLSISNYSLGGTASQGNYVKYNDVSSSAYYATGVSIANSTKYGTASQSNYIGSYNSYVGNTITVHGTQAVGIRLDNSVYYGGDASQFNAMFDNVVNVYGADSAIGVLANNYASITSGNYGRASQSNFMTGETIYASASGDGFATGVMLNNTLNSGTYYSLVAEALQTNDIAGSTITAVSDGYATGVEANNTASGWYYNHGASQLVTVHQNSMVSASGYYAAGIMVDNAVYGYYGASGLQSLAVADSTILANASATSGSIDAIAIGAFNYNGSFAGTAGQTLSVISSTLGADGAYSIGVWAVNSDNSAYGLTLQSVTLQSNWVNSSKYGASLWNLENGGGYAGQIATVSGNTFVNADYGLLLDSDNTNQLVNVSGNFFEYGGTLNVGSGTCIGIPLSQCQP